MLLYLLLYFNTSDVLYKQLLAQLNRGVEKVDMYRNFCLWYLYRLYRCR